MAPSVKGNTGPMETTSNESPNRVSINSSYASIENTRQHAPEPIAIVGMAFQLPGGAVTEDALWRILVEKQCTSSEFPSDRIRAESFYHPDLNKQNTIHTRKGHFLEEDIYKFDASFFSIAPPDAASMDPCQRGLLETTYHALENAGISLQSISGTNTSVHVGCFTNDYMTLAFRDSQRIPKYAASGCSTAILSNRLSWFYNLRGPSLTLDTACSSGIVALDLACQGLWAGKTDAAIVATANLILSPELTIAMSNLSFLSKDGRCFSFDHRANGYARGEGFVTLILKPLSKAFADRDNIRALIRSSGTNQDGHTSAGLMQPSGDLQAQLIRETYQKAKLDMKDTTFFEAHGTGTPVGDPTEAAAIGEAFQGCRSTNNPLIIGASKPNLGHTEGTSGLASIAKVILSMENGLIPPNTNFEKLNSSINAQKYNLLFPAANISWPAGKIKRASVNSFGFGGTNAHVVLDDVGSYLQSKASYTGHLSLYDKQLSVVFRTPHGNGNKPHDCKHSAQMLDKNVCYQQNSHSILSTSNASNDDGNVAGHANPKLLILSASDEPGIKRQAAAQTSFLQKYKNHFPKNFVQNYAYTLAVRRTQLRWTSYCVISSPAELQNLESLISTPTTKLENGSKLGLIFTGQGAQWPGMAQELFRSDPIFRASMLRSQHHLHQLGCNLPALNALVDPSYAELLETAQYSQALTTMVQMALVDLLFWLGIEPSVVIGHSSGEIAAAYAAGHISDASAIRIAYYRGFLGSELEKGNCEEYGMVAVGLSLAEVTTEIHHLQNDSHSLSQSHSLSVGCINSPSNVTVSGPSDQIDALVSRLQGKDVFARRLKVKLGYHSQQMFKLSARYLEYLDSLEYGTMFHAKTSPVMVSSVTADVVDREFTCRGEYWVRNMVSAVDFLGAMQSCNRLEKVINGWLEVGPHSTLQGPVREILQSLSVCQNQLYKSALVRNQHAVYCLLNALGELHSHGFNIDLARAMRIGLNAEEIEALSPLTNLPKYQFNHTIRYIDQSPSDVNFRLRAHGNHDFLGSQVGEPNAFESQWKFIIKDEELPWIRDHRVGGAILYPAAGMLVMAIEALKQILSFAPPPALEMHNVEFTAPVNISASRELTELRLYMSASITDLKDADFGFRIFLCKPGNAHDLVCRGNIQGDYSTRPSKDSEALYANTGERNVFENAIKTCSQHLTQSEIYATIHDHTDFNYGPEFQILDNVQFDKKGRAIATVLPYCGECASPYTVHPSRLESLLQICLPALHGMGRSSTLVPTSISRLWLSAAGFGHATFSPKNEKVFTAMQSAFSRYAVFNTKIVDDSSNSPKARINGLEFTVVADERNASSSDMPFEDADYVASHIKWMVDVDSLTIDDIQQYCEEGRPNMTTEHNELFPKLNSVLLQFGSRVLQEIEGMGGMAAPSYFHKYLRWLRHHVERMLPSTEFAEDLEGRCSDLLPNSVAATCIMVAKNLVNVFRGDVDPLALLYGPDSGINDFYTGLYDLGHDFDLLHRYLASLVHKTPDLQFLEIGAGTGSLTEHVLDTVGYGGTGAAFEQYTFTDISPFFFGKAQEKFTTYKNRMVYATLDIETDPISQGFVANSYDVILADNVLHATQDLRFTLTNIRRLLKPGGKVVIRELTTPSLLVTGFVAGMLSGWWRATEADRQLSPCMEEGRWNAVLQETGFSGTDLIFKDNHDDHCHLWSVMVGTAIEPQCLPVPYTPVAGHHTNASPIFVIDPQSTLQIDVASSISEELQMVHSRTNLLSLTDAATFSQQQPILNNFIFLDDVEQPFLCDITETSLTALRTLLQTSRSLLWVRKSIASSPKYAISDGLLRVARQENPLLTLVNMSVDQRTIDSKHVFASKIAYIFSQLQKNYSSNAPSLELEFAVIDSRLHIPRLNRATVLDSHIHCLNQRPIRHQIWDGRSLQLSIRAPGLLDTLCFREDVVSALAPLSELEIEVEVMSIGANFKDLLTLLGRVKSDALGLEAAGVVRKRGVAVQDLQIGDRVAVCAIDSFKTCIRCSVENAVKIPECLSFTIASAIPVGFSTAYYSLVDVARLRPGEKILIHAAAGGTGQAAVQIAQWVGAEVFCTVGTEDKKQLLIDTYQIPEDHILHSRDSSFLDGIMRKTGVGVDVVLNSTSGKLLEASWRCIAPFGRFIEIGLKDILGGGKLPMDVFSRNASFSAVDLTAVLTRNDGFIKRLMTRVFELFEQEKLQAVQPIHQYSISETEQAFRFLQSGVSAGKLVFQVEKGVDLNIIQGPHSNYNFPQDATYVIAGGLGGLGRTIAQWLVERGARNLILLSRSGLEGNQRAKEVVSLLRERGVQVRCPRCDVCQLSELKDMISNCSGMPPIRGCFQAVLVDDSATISTMTHASWLRATSPKVLGSWNLHLAMPPSMSFFILLSSAVGVISNDGQGAYAAANTYLDGLAYHLSITGQRKNVMSLDLGYTLGEGYAAENKRVMDNFRGLDALRPNTIPEILAILDYYCNPDMATKSPHECQVVTGIEIPANILAKGSSIPIALRRPLFKHLHLAPPTNDKKSQSSSSQPNSASNSFIQEFTTASSPTEGAAVAAEAFRHKLAHVLNIDAEHINVAHSVTSYGVDSLVGLELKNWLAKEMRADLAVFEIVGSASLKDVGMCVAERSGLKPREWDD